MTSKVNISTVFFNDEVEARNYLERVRWPDGVVCPHCGSLEGAYKVESRKTRSGLYKC